MAGSKRKELWDNDRANEGASPKKSKSDSESSKRAGLPVYHRIVVDDSTDGDEFNGLPESDISSDSGIFESESDESTNANGGAAKGLKADDSREGIAEATSGATNSSTSRESHAKQKILAQERKAAKPNASSIQRSKKIWERLRRKSHVPLEERKALVTELFNIITGHIKDFVFKHDSVRIIQTALKYANLEQRRMIARELKGEYRLLAESRYGKFLVGKLLAQGGDEIRDLIIPEFYGNVRRMIKHSEASWILDDTYRGIATPQQKARILREWYGAEFALFKAKDSALISANLSDIIEEHPEKRSPIMKSLHELINHLVQKKQTGFTLLHDAVLQYFLNTKVGSEDRSEFIELLKGDEQGDLLKNLAFTGSGARVVSLALAYGTAKDRKQILRAYKDIITTLAYDPHGHLVLLTALDVIDDTVLTAKSILSEFLPKALPAEKQYSCIIDYSADKNARVVLLYPFAGQSKRLLTPEHMTFLNEMHSIRKTTSKKDPETRRKEHIREISAACLAAIEHHAQELSQTPFGCHYMSEVLVDAEGDKHAALSSVADLAAGNPSVQGHVSLSSAACRMLKTLVAGGRFDAKTNRIEPALPPLGFAAMLYSRIKPVITQWATGSGSFVVVALLEANDFEDKAEVIEVLEENKSSLKQAAQSKRVATIVEAQEKPTVAGGKRPRKNDTEQSLNSGNVGAKLLLEKLG